MKVLVTVAGYPDGDSHAMQFVHTRNLKYLDNGIDVIVLNFATHESYSYEGVEVISLKEFKCRTAEFYGTTLICHAPNLKGHAKLLLKHEKMFKQVIFFFHGHEIVNIQQTYPRPYEFNKKNCLFDIAQRVYDEIKLLFWRHYFQNADKNNILIFVSNVLKEDFCRYVTRNRYSVDERCFIINNSVGEVFEKEHYDINSYKKYDYITIRSNLDSSVYCIDKICELAKKNSQAKFLVIGCGNYFMHNSIPSNITWINRSMDQTELIKYINLAKIGLMPTRRDSQGVMTSELLTFGIPVITSDLDICREMFSQFENVKMLREDELVDYFSKVEFPMKFFQKNNKFFQKNTINKEIEIIKGMLK